MLSYNKQDYWHFSGMLLNSVVFNKDDDLYWLSKYTELHTLENYLSRIQWTLYKNGLMDTKMGCKDLSSYLSVHQIHTHKQIRTVTYISGLNPSLGRLSWNPPVLLLNSSVPCVTYWAPYHFSPSEKRDDSCTQWQNKKRIKFLSLIAHSYLETSFMKCWRKHVLCLIWHRRDRGKGNAYLRSSTTNLCYTGPSLTE